MTDSEISPLPIETSSEIWPVFAMGLDGAPRPRQKVAPTGEPTFATPTVLRGADRDGNSRPDKQASIHVLRPAAAYPQGTYCSKGRVWVQPYVTDGGRLALSITVDELVPVDGSTSSGSSSAKGSSSGSSSAREAS